MVIDDVSFGFETRARFRKLGRVFNSYRQGILLFKDFPTPNWKLGLV